MWRVGTLVGVTGTGTGIGKTHVARALIEALRALGADVVGWKPVESGVVGERGDDEAQLAAASEPATAPTLRLRAPLSPHLAARREGSPIDPAALAKLREVVLARCEVLVMELAGGLFSPFDDRLDNADWLVGSDARVVVVAPDRLGVLHDTSAVLRAARPLGLTIEAIDPGRLDRNQRRGAPRSARDRRVRAAASAGRHSRARSRAGRSRPPAPRLTERSCTMRRCSAGSPS
jgi:dethiobiotin synthetase